MEMQLPDRIIIDSVDLSRDIDKLIKILKIYLKYIKCSEFVDVGNDIQYAIKEIRTFRKKLKNLVLEEVSKYEVDLFGYRFRTFRTYRYLELLFSEDYKKISSLRFYNKRKNKTLRYSIFNLPNPYDLNIISLIYNIKEIIQDFEGSVNSQTQYIDFLKNYFLPIPGIYNKKQKDIKCLDNVSKKFDTGKPKTYDEVLRENEKFSFPDFKAFIYDIRKLSFDSNNSIDFLLGEGKIEEIIAKLEEYVENEPLKAIDTVYEEILNKFNIADLISFAQQMGLPEINIFPIDILNNLSIVDLFEKIDFLPKQISKQIYSDLNNTEVLRQIGLDFDISSIISQIEDFANNILIKEEPKCAGKVKITKVKKSIKFKDIFLNLKNKFPNIYPKIEDKFNELFPRDLFINIILKYVNLDSFSLKVPRIEIPKINLSTLEITDLFGDFSNEFDELVLKIVSISLTEITKGLLELLLKIGKLDDFLLQNVISNASDFDPKIPKFQNIFKEDWLIYLDYAYRLLVDTNNLIKIPEPISENVKKIKNPNNINKIKARKKPIGVDICSPALNNPIATRLSKKNKKILMSKNLDSIIDSGDIDSVLENIKLFSYSEQHDYFNTKNVSEEKIVSILRTISESLDEQIIVKNKKIPSSSIEIGKSLSDMIQQIETILTPKELALLLKGKYTNTTAEIVRTICRINFPLLSDKVDPIKYFTMLGKIIGNVNGAMR